MMVTFGSNKVEKNWDPESTTLRGSQVLGRDPAREELLVANVVFIGTVLVPEFIVRRPEEQELGKVGHVFRSIQCAGGGCRALALPLSEDDEAAVPCCVIFPFMFRKAPTVGIDSAGESRIETCMGVSTTPGLKEPTTTLPPPPSRNSRSRTLYDW